MADSMTSAQRSRCMSRIRSRDTKPELELRRALFGVGLRFRVRTGLKGRPDVVFTRARVAVFVDGCFWHGCPVHGTKPKSNTAYWTAKLARNKERDAEVAAALTGQGWLVMRYWDHDVHADVGRIVEELVRLRLSRIARLAPGTR